MPPSLNVVYFSIGSAEITNDARLILDTIADYLKKASVEKVTVYAFSDPSGSAARNLGVMRERATAVQQFFMAKGLDPKRVEIPEGAFQVASNKFPPSEYWRLRKVMVKFSDAALAKVEASEQKESREAEEDAQPVAATADPKLKSSVRAASDAEKAKEPKDPKDSKGVVKKEVAEPATPGLEVVDVLYWKSVNHSLFLIAKARGYFREEGLDVRLHEASNLEANQVTIGLAEGVGTVRQPLSAMDLKKKKYFLGAVCPYGFHEAVNKKIPLVQIGGMLANSTTMVMKKELVEQVQRNPAAFSGKSIARLKGAPTYIDYALIFANALTKAGIPYTEKWFKDHWEMEQALAKGEVDAMHAAPPWDELIVSRHSNLGILEMRGLYPDLPCCRQLVTRDQLRDPKMRDRYKRFERAMIRAHKYFLENKAATAHLVASILKVPDELVARVFARKGYTLDPNPNLKGSLAWYSALKSTIGPQDVREDVDTSIYEDALLSLAKEFSADSYYGDAIRRFKQTN